MKRRLLSVICILFVVCTLLYTATQAEPSFLNPLTTRPLTPADVSLAEFSSAALMDLSTGSILYLKSNLNTTFPAFKSPVTLMTAYIAATTLSYNTTISCGDELLSLGGSSSIGLSVGDKLTVQDLLAAVLLAGAQDAVAVLANYIAPSVSDFVALMNQTAVELGMTNTYYLDPFGEYLISQQTSMRDLLTLTAAAYEHKLITDILSETKYSIESLDGKFSKTISNSLGMMTRSSSGYDNRITGIGAASLSSAGTSVLLTAKQDNRTLVLVMYSSSHNVSYAQIASGMFSFGFDLFSTVDFTDITESLLEDVSVTVSAVNVTGFTLPDAETSPVLASVEASFAPDIKNNASAFSVSVSNPVYEAGQVRLRTTLKYLDKTVSVFSAYAEAPEALQKLHATPEPLSTHTPYHDLPTHAGTPNVNPNGGSPPSRLSEFMWVFYVAGLTIVCIVIILIANHLKKRML